MRFKEIFNEAIDERAEFIQKYGKSTWKEQPDGTIDVSGDVRVTYLNLNLKKIPVQFGKVGGDFYCTGNKLTSLQGAPSEVGGNFYCFENQLTSLQGAPSKVGGNFNCSDNKLTSLKGAPSKVGGKFVHDEIQRNI